MDVSNDLQELDDWLGTLEELQYDLNAPTPELHLACSPQHQPFGVLRPNPSSRSHSISSPPKHLGAWQQQYHSDSNIPNNEAQVVEMEWIPASIRNQSTPSNGYHETGMRLSLSTQQQYNNYHPQANIPQVVTPLATAQSVRASFNVTSCKEATAENDLNSLLKELQAVEEKMKELETSESEYTRRYSLTSSVHATNTTATISDHLSISSGLHPRPPSLFHVTDPSTLSVHSYDSGIQAPASIDGSDCISTAGGDTPVSLGPNSPPGHSSMAHFESANNGVPPHLYKSALNADSLHSLNMHFNNIPLSHPGNRTSCGSSSGASSGNPDNSHNPGKSNSHYQIPQTHPTITYPAVQINHNNNNSPSPYATGMVMTTSSSSLSSHQQGQNYHHQQQTPSQMMRSTNGVSYPGVGFVGNIGSRADRGSICSSLSRGSASTEDCDFDRSYEESPEITQKINQVMEKVEKLNLEKIVVRVFHANKTTKAILIDEKMRVGQVQQLLLEKNFLQPSLKLALVEKVPNLKMERVLEDHEYLADCILSWPENSKNMIFFEEREDKHGVFTNTKKLFGEDFSDAKGHMSQSSMKEIFGGVEPCVPEVRDYIYIKKPGEKTWTRKYCVVRSSGLYACKKKKSSSPSDMMRIVVLNNQYHLYTTTGGWTKLKAPTPFGFALKPYSAQDRHSKFVFYFCATDEASLHRWCSALRIAKYGHQLQINYEAARASLLPADSSTLSNATTSDNLSLSSGVVTPFPPPSCHVTSPASFHSGLDIAATTPTAPSHNSSGTNSGTLGRRLVISPRHSLCDATLTPPSGRGGADRHIVACSTALDRKGSLPGAMNGSVPRGDDQSWAGVRRSVTVKPQFIIDSGIAKQWVHHYSDENWS